MLQPGHTLGRYRVEEKLGAGGMGEVYRAWDSLLRRWVALKVVPKASSQAERLLGEARAAAALRHASIVSVYDVGEDGDYAFVSMDLVEGRPLRDYVGDTSIEVDERLAWLMQIANALRAAHKAGLVHRDIKPDNVMIGDDRAVRVLDFGLAKSFSVDVTAPTAAGDAAGPERFHTAEGRVSGTPAYMAPEQLAGGPPSPSWDQYAWGVLACELLTGKHPRIAGLVSVSGWVNAESLAHVPTGPAQVVARAMAPSPDQRFPSMDAVVEALGGPVSVPVPPVPATSSPPNASVGSATMNVQIGDTLQVPVHPNAPAPQRSRRTLVWIVGLAGVLGASVVVGMRLRPPTPAAARSAPPPTATPIASAAPPPSAPAPSVSIAPVIAASVPVAPSPPIVARPPPRRKLDITFRPAPTFQYDTAAIMRIMTPMKPLIRQCIENHPPHTLPATMVITLELWTLGDEIGKVREVRMGEPPPLVACVRDALLPVEFGPGKNPQMPPGGIFVTVAVDGT
ncbi:MAG TPA: serine/threonine-protein kinase [Polyangiaceae bacterium]